MMLVFRDRLNNRRKKFFFSEEKTQKTFGWLSRSRRQHARQDKSSLLLSFKKEGLSSLSRPAAEGDDVGADARLDEGIIGGFDAAGEVGGEVMKLALG